MSPAAVAENEGECKASEPVQYPLVTGISVLGDGGDRGSLELGAVYELLVLAVPGYYCGQCYCSQAKDWSGNAEGGPGLRGFGG